MSSLQAATITPARRLRGRLRVPGDKSIAHRYGLLAALAEGRSIVHDFAPGADCRSTLRCLSRLGVAIEEGPAGTVSVCPCRRWPPATVTLSPATVTCPPNAARARSV